MQFLTMSKQLIGDVAPGKVLVRALPKKDMINGITLPDSKAEDWGVVEQMGPPMRELYSLAEVFLYRVFGWHPSPIKKGWRVLLPKTSGRTFERDGQVYYVFWEAEIEAYESVLE